MQTGELVATGAVTLGTFALASIAAVLVCYLLDPDGSTSRHNQICLTVLAIAGMVAAVLFSRPEKPVIPVVVVAGITIPLGAREAFKSRSPKSDARLLATFSVAPWPPCSRSSCGNSPNTSGSASW